MHERKPIICRRCRKPIADKGIEVQKPDTVDQSPEAQDRYKIFAAKFCVCDRRSSSEFTSSQQPPNLDDIEKRMK
jgi:hypothetical protein